MTRKLKYAIMGVERVTDPFLRQILIAMRDNLTSIKASVDDAKTGVTKASVSNSGAPTVVTADAVASSTETDEATVKSVAEQVVKKKVASPTVSARTVTQRQIYLGFVTTRDDEVVTNGAGHPVYAFVDGGVPA